MFSNKKNVHDKNTSKMSANICKYSPKDYQGTLYNLTRLIFSNWTMHLIWEHASKGQKNDDGSMSTREP
jgi:hypothetical protein